MTFFNRSTKSKVIYVSYIADDIFYASEVAEYLQCAGYTVVTTPHNEAKALRASLCKAIVESCDTVISITSPTASRSECIWRDMGTARLNDTPVIPLVVHHFTEPIPMRHFINAVDDLDLGCERLEMAMERANGYVNNELGKRLGIARRAMKAIATAAVVAVMAIISAMFS
jgi:TIR domain-containing protein